MPIYPDNPKNLGQTANNSGKFKAGEPKFLVQHYTAGGDGAASAKYLFGKHSPASSAHFVVDRNGDVIQISDTNMITWHAGNSFWRGISSLNSHSIGIEIANYGYWRPGIRPATAAAAESDGWLKMKHKNGGPEYLWEPYLEPQLKAVEELTKWILKTHPTIREIVGHDDIAPKRKIDPGPAFPMLRFQNLMNPLTGDSKVPEEMKDDVIVPVTKKSSEYKVNAATLNVRGGPGTDFGTTKAGPLKKGQVVTLLSEQGDWSFVKTAKGEGWVFGQFLTPT